VHRQALIEHRNIPDLRLDPADPRLEWEQAADRVRAAIRSSQLASGDTLPSVPDLATLQGLKPGTVRHMFLALAEEGLVHIRHGRTTTFARTPRPTRIAGWPTCQSRISRTSCTSRRTVKTHIRYLQGKLGTHRRGEAVTRARALGLLAPAGRR
jgi:hypothetical protein